MEYRTLDSLLIPRWPRNHSLSGVSPAKRQDFVSRCPSGFQLLFGVNLAAAWRFCAAPRPHILGGTSTPLCLRASSAAGARLLLWSARRSARSRKNNRLSKLRRARPALARRAPATSARALARLASAPLMRVARPWKAPPANPTPHATPEWPQCRAASPAPAQPQTALVACARVCDHPGASARLPHRAPWRSAHPIPSLLRASKVRVSLSSAASHLVRPQTALRRSPVSGPPRAAQRKDHRSD